jgi:hypothetical protein
MKPALNQSWLPPPFTLVSCSDYSSTLKMEAKCSSETSVDFQALCWTLPFTLVSCSAYSSTLKMKALYSSETSVDFQALCLPPAFRLVSCSAYSSTFKMEAICSSETSVDFQRTTRRYIPEDNHRCENLKFTDFIRKAQSGILHKILYRYV